MRKISPIPMLCVAPFKHNGFPFIKWRTYTIIKSGEGSILFGPHRPGWRDCEMKLEDLNTHLCSHHLRVVQGSFE